MNQGGGGGGGSGNNGRKKIFGTLPNNGRKDRRDEEEALHPVRYGLVGNYPLYRMASVKKGSGGGGGYEFLADQSGKNDYDCKSNESSAMSQFSGNSVTTKQSSGICKSPNTKQKGPPRSVTPSERSSVLTQATKCKQLPSNQKLNQLSNANHNSRRANVASTTATKPMNQQRESPQNFLASNLSKSMLGPSDSKMKPRSRLSPLVRSSVPAQIPTRRQSCSPSVTRGRKVEPKPENTSTTGAITTATATTITETATTISQKGRIQLAGNGTQILGSRMVDKFMNARKSIAEERETKLKFHGSINESSGFGRTMISKSSLDMALKHMFCRLVKLFPQYPESFTLYKPNNSMTCKLAALQVHIHRQKQLKRDCVIRREEDTECWVHKLSKSKKSCVKRGNLSKHDMICDH
ncbi:hypothetical protein HYC85_000437 [Camellia sinensis]|uniref:Uncharacterized protein n=1 Tax=Camellia sinensis TaxID=4442 RepID=A0A7J7I551_CAMSI|nr:hypothetical protein HYC85_000437 [Camellia sinensis]